jgi:hypothetical protein
MGAQHPDFARLMMMVRTERCTNQLVVVTSPLGVE